MVYAKKDEEQSTLSLLEAALIGFEQMKWNVEEQIADIRGDGSRYGTRPDQARGHTLSPVDRRRIAVAEGKRWGTL